MEDATSPFRMNTSSWQEEPFCNLKVDRSIIKQKLGIYAAKRPDEFVAEAVSSTKNTKLEKTVKKLFKERTSE